MTDEYSNVPYWEFYGDNLLNEYDQCYDEGLDIERYRKLFEEINMTDKNRFKKQLADVCFELIKTLPKREGYKYEEPSEYPEILAARKSYAFEKKPFGDLKDKVKGAWLGRTCGCMLGKSIEGMKSHELTPLLQESGNLPMHRYILRSDITDEVCAKYAYPLKGRIYADEIDGMPPDDDTNYTVLYQRVVEDYGLDFTSDNIADAWIKYQPMTAYCTAERVAYVNFANGIRPPESARFQNAYRELIGAQIRADYFGYINPGNPEKAAEMAYRDACISHVKNGIYGEMLMAAMIAAAAVSDDIQEAVRAGLAEIPEKSRLYEGISSVLDKYNEGMSSQDMFAYIHGLYNEYTDYGSIHTVNNAMIVVAALLYGKGDYGKTICLAVETGFDTDCNAATAGSVLGMMKGTSCIDEYWQKPINGKINTDIHGFETVTVDEVAEITLKHIGMNK